MKPQQNHESLKAAWEAVARADWDAVAAAFAEEMIFVLPGQTDVIRGRDAFRAALEGFDKVVPPGFEIVELRYCLGDDEITNILEWKSDKLPGGSQSAILFKFDKQGMITEERWYVDTEQWKAGF